jgi:predicted permease
METLWQDIRFGIRMLVKRPGFTIIAVITLALGIGANTTIFTLVNAVLLQPLPVKDPAQLVGVFGTDVRNNLELQQFLPISHANIEDLRDKNNSLSGMASLTFFGASLSSGDKPELLNGQLVSGNYFDVLGVKAAQGRTFSPEEGNKPGAYPVVVLSDGLWKRRFGGDPALIGKQITLNQQQFNVIGVAPKNFHGTFAIGTPDLWISDAMHDQVLTGLQKAFFLDRRALECFAFGRLKPGVTIQQAESELKALATGLSKDFPEPNGGRNVRLIPLALATVDPNLRGQFAQAGALLMTVVGLVLLIACANLANLQLARATEHQKEIAVRLSLGASRSRLVRQLLTENLLLALLGGGLGLLLALWSREVLISFRPPFLNPNDLPLELDGRVLAFSLVASVLTGLLFGLAPAWQALRPKLSETLKEGGGRSGAGGGRHRLRNLLVVSETALAIIALVGAGLFLQSLRSAQKIDPGFETKHLMVMSFDLGAQNYSEPQGKEFQRQLLEKLKAMPMVTAASLASNAPFGGGFQRTVFPEGLDSSDRRNGVLVIIDQVDSSYFDTAGIPVLRGRKIAETDSETAPMIAVVNETMARKFFPGQDALGKRFKFFGETWILEIVGIARDSKYNTLGEDPQPCIYLSMRQHYSPAVTLHIRTAGDPSAVLSTARSAVQSLDSSLPLVNVQTISETLNQSLWAARMGAGLLVLFGLLALLLAAVGIYGVMSYSVSQRTQEIGIRVALGAQRGDVLQMVVRQGLGLTLIGVALGLVAAFTLLRGIGSLLYGVSVADPVTFAGVPAILAGVALVACYIPARRATRVDPLVALRYE